MAFDASPSWSGFNYQGKVALYYALKCINSELIEKDFSGYSLMLEDNEDFEIIIDNASTSFHQVKAYEKSSYSKYSDALLEITLELSKNPNVTGKIHTWKIINFKANCNDLRSSIKDDIQLILNEYQSSINQSSILHKAASDSKNPCKTTSIIRNAYTDKSDKELALQLQSILSGTNDALSRISAYKYDDGNSFCDLSNINAKIKSELSIGFSQRNIPVTTSQLNKAFLYFLGVMDRYIIHRHKNKQSPTKIPITFIEIIDALNIDHEDVSNEYVALNFKDRFFFYIYDFMEDPDEEYQFPEPGSQCNLQEIRKLLLNLSAHELWEHYRNFSPHIDLQNSNIVNTFETDFTGIRHVLIRIFHDLDFNLATYTQNNYKLMYRSISPPHQNYLPTTIKNHRKVTQIERAISSNKGSIEILYEVENLIYDGHTIESISPNTSKHTDVPLALSIDLRSKRNEPLKVINLIPLTDAKEQLTK